MTRGELNVTQNLNIFSFFMVAENSLLIFTANSSTLASFFFNITKFKREFTTNKIYSSTTKASEVVES